MPIYIEREREKVKVERDRDFVFAKSGICIMHSAVNISIFSDKYFCSCAK